MSFASVFSDGEIKERLISIGVILLIYCLFSAVWGFLQPFRSWKWGLYIGIPGALFLLIYTLTEFNPYYLLYVAGIIFFACLGAWGGSLLRNRKKV